MSSPIRRISGFHAASHLGVLLLLTLPLGGCVYSLRAGSGLPDHIQTIAVIPFDNETNRFELTQEIFLSLSRDLPRALGVRTAGEDVADAVVRGRITRYVIEAPLFRPGPDGDRTEVLQREVTVAISVEIIDVELNEILWENRNLSVRGQYLESTETEQVGRAEAIEILVQRIVDGAQSNW